MNLDAETLIQALNDQTRLRAVILLDQEDVLCVCELTAALDVSQPKMSRHLAILRAMGVVVDRRIGNRVFYLLHPHLRPWARSVVRALGEDVRASEGFAEILDRLKGMPNRPGGNGHVAASASSLMPAVNEDGDAL